MCMIKTDQDPAGENTPENLAEKRVSRDFSHLPLFQHGHGRVREKRKSKKMNTSKSFG